MSPRDSRVAVAVLAAGASTRMGAGACKLARPFAGTTLLARALDAASSSQADEVFAVLGAHRGLTAPIAVACGVRAVENPGWEKGQATSVALAAAVAAREGFDALLVMVADQPFVDACHLDALMGAFRADRARATGPARPGAAGTVPCAYAASADGRRGNPCLFTRGLFGDLRRLTGDEGARQVLRACPDAVRAVDVGDPVVFEDADTPADLARLAALYAWRRPTPAISATPVPKGAPPCPQR